MTDPLRIVIADGQVATRNAVRNSLQAASCQVVAEAADAAGAVAAARRHRPDVCLLDVHMPGSGIMAAAEITRTLPDTRIVMLTASVDDEDLFAALRAGAAGYLLKDMDSERLGPALRGVMAGEVALPRWLMRKVVDEFHARPRRRVRLPRAGAAARLTDRESEILDLMAEGLSTEEIAGRLFLAQVTVRTHISAVVRKLRVQSRDAAIRLARGDAEPA